MDAAPTRRAFPGFTLAELEARAASGNASEAMLAEIEARKSGASVHFKVPQIEGGKVVPLVGRM